VDRREKDLRWQRDPANGVVIVEVPNEMAGYEAACGTFGIRHESTRRHAAQVQPCQLSSARLNKSRHRPRSVRGVRAQPRRRWRSGRQQVSRFALGGAAKMALTPL
jgi:hypothetical protein